jgi:NAD+ kinase
LAQASVEREAMVRTKSEAVSRADGGSRISCGKSSEDLPVRPAAIGLIVNTERPGAITFAQEFGEWLKTLGLVVCATCRAAEVSEQATDLIDCLRTESDLMIVLGGDGSILGAARLAAPHGIPILGVHWGGMGFLNECQPADARPAVERILAGDYFIEERLMLQAELWREGEVCCRRPALNDVTVTRDTLSRILRLDLEIGDQTAASYRGDGIVISTPTGSTGHSLSAGGPVLDPRVEALVATPICPHSLSGRAVVVPTSERIRIRHFSPLANVTVTVDGQIGVSMREGDILEVGIAPWRARFIRFGSYPFYKNLRDKLNWRL